MSLKTEFENLGGHFLGGRGRGNFFTRFEFPDPDLVFRVNFDLYLHRITEKIEFENLRGVLGEGGGEIFLPDSDSPTTI